MVNGSMCILTEHVDKSTSKNIKKKCLIGLKALEGNVDWISRVDVNLSKVMERKS